LGKSDDIYSMAYSVDFRRAAVAFWDIKHDKEKLKAIFGIYPSAVNRWKKLGRETGSLEPQYPETHAGKIDIKKLEKDIEECPEAYLHELAEKHGVTKQAVHYAEKRLGITRKKKPSHTGKNQR